MSKGLLINYDGNQNIRTVDDEFSIDIPLLPEQVWLRAACDGLLLLLGDSGTLYACNPITRRCSILPPTPSMYPGPNPYLPCAKPIPFNKLLDWIFFFDSSVQKYKVFGISDRYMGCVMLTFGDFSKNQWSQRIPLEDGQAPTSPVIFLGNQLHWAGFDVCNYREIICSMDVVTKDIKNRLGPPRPGPGLITARIFLVEVKGRVCFTRAFPTHLDLWVLEGTAPKDHWEKHFTTPVFSGINLFKDARLCLVPMKHAASNHLSGLLKLFIHHEDKLFYFDFNSLDLNQIALLDHCPKLCQFSHFHFGSLVSWNPSNQTASSGMQGTSHWQNPLRKCNTKRDITDSSSSGMQGTSHWKNPLRKCNTKRDITDSSNCDEKDAKVPRLN